MKTKEKVIDLVLSGIKQLKFDNRIPGVIFLDEESFKLAKNYMVEEALKAISRNLETVIDKHAIVEIEATKLNMFGLPVFEVKDERFSGIAVAEIQE